MNKPQPKFGAVRFEDIELDHASRGGIPAFLIRLQLFALARGFDRPS